MAKVVVCRQVGMDCDGVVRAETEDAALAAVAEHVREVHGIHSPPSEVVARVREVMWDDSPAAAG